MKAALIILTLLLAACVPQNNVDALPKGGLEVAADEVEYAPGIRGYYAHPAGEYPGVVMIHEWWGLNDNIRQMARQLAAEGYAVLAVDLYNGSVASSPDEARALVGGLDQEQATANMQAAVAFLRSGGAQRVASLGWCFGGAQSLRLSLSGERLDGTIIYYGTPVTDASELERISWPVLGIFGSQDTSIPVDTVSRFENALERAGVENDVRIYDGVGHAFANPSGANYAPEQTADAWNRTVSFLAQNLR